MLTQEGIGVEQYSFPTVKPIDKTAIIECAKKVKLMVTLEEHNIVGGFGSAVSEVLTDAGCGQKLLRLGLNDEYCSKVGSQTYLREQFGLDAKSVAEKVKRALK